jgi:DNA-directed RNA polymerase specialized sigma24 family protein
VTGQPTLEYAARVEVIPPCIDRTAIRRAWRVRTRLEGLLVSRLIDPDEYDAACAFRAAYEHAAGGPTRSALASDGPSGRSGDGLLGALDDVRRVAQVMARLTHWQRHLVVGCVVLDLSWAELARHLDVAPTTIPRRLAPILRHLTEVWESLDSQQQSPAANTRRPSPTSHRRKHRSSNRCL